METVILVKEDKAMKRFIVITALAAITLTACNRDLSPEQPKKGVAFTATTENPATKTALNKNGSNYEVVWQNEDQITVVDAASHVGVYSTTSTTTKGDFTFESGTEATTAPYKAYYPATLYNSGTPTLPATQNYVEGNISGSPMYAESSTESLAFKNICGIIRLNVSTTQTGKKVRRIVLSANQGMSGAISNAATLAADGYVAEVSGTASITLDCGESGVDIGSTAKPFHFAVPGNTYTGLGITVETTDGLSQTLTLKSDKTVVVGRSKITDITLPFNNIMLVIDLTESNSAITIPSGVDAKLIGHNYRRNVIIEGGNSSITLEDAEMWKLNINGDATIISKGSNTVNPYDDYENPIYIKEGATVTFQGDGTLTTQASYGSVVACENNNANIVFKSGTYNFKSISYSTQTILVGNLTIEGGTVTADCSGGYYDGIYATKNVTITGGTVNAYGRTHGIYVNGGNLSISGGEVTSNQTTTNFGSFSPERTVAGISVHEETTGGTLTISGGKVSVSAKRGPGIGTSWYHGGWSQPAWTKSITLSGGTITISTESPDGNAAIGYTGFGAKTQCDGITITNGITSLTLIQAPTATKMFQKGDSEISFTVDGKDLSAYFTDPSSVDWTFDHIQRTVSTTTATDDTWTFTKK